MIIEMCDDIIRVSHGFDGCQMLEYIADSNTSALKTGDDDITSSESLHIRRICWRVPEKSQALFFHFF
jgi:hypothetical protein